MINADLVGTGLGRRLRDVRAAIERQSAFVFGGSEEPAEIVESDSEVARDFVLRSIATMVDPVNYAMMRQLDGIDRSTADVSAAMKLDHVVVWERTNDMIQVGLVGRDLERDVAGLTPPGQELLDLVEAIAGIAQGQAGVDRP